MESGETLLFRRATHADLILAGRIPMEQLDAVLGTGGSELPDDIPPGCEAYWKEYLAGDEEAEVDHTPDFWQLAIRLCVGALEGEETRPCWFRLQGPYSDQVRDPRTLTVADLELIHLFARACVPLSDFGHFLNHWSFWYVWNAAERLKRPISDFIFGDPDRAQLDMAAAYKAFLREQDGEAKPKKPEDDLSDFDGMGL